MYKILPSHYPRISLAALLLAAIFSLGFFQSDEHFQILEFAALKLGMIAPEMMPWEFEYQMRSALQPLIALALHKSLLVVGIEDPFITTAILRVGSALLSWLSFVLLYQAFLNECKSDRQKKIFGYLTFLLWCGIFVGVRYSSEGWSGSLFMIAMSWYLLSARGQRAPYFLLGIILGLAFLTRYQVGVMILGFGLWLWLIKKESLFKLTSMGLGFILVIIMGLLIDRWFYGQWTITIWHYIDQNIIQDKVSDFGIDPWYAYLPMTFLALIPPFSLIAVISFLALLYKKPKSVLVWCTVPFLLIHFVIGHKELRFLFPLIGFIPPIVLCGYQLLEEGRFKPYIIRVPRRAIYRSFHWINTLLLLFVCFFPLDRTTPLYRKIFYRYTGPVKIFYQGADPYKEGHLTFYKRDHVVVKKFTDDPITTTADTTYLFIADRPQTKPPAIFSSEHSYSTIPSWAYHINFNGWIERTRAWYLYELRP